MDQIKSFQHYVPKFLLEYFASDGLLWVYDRQQKVFRQQPPKRTAGEKAYYVFQEKDGKKNPALEKMFSAIEDQAAPIIKNLHSGKKEISEQEKADLAMFIAALYLRVPDNLKRTDDMSILLTKERLRKSVMFEEHFQRTMDQIEKKKGIKISPERRKDVQKTFAEKNYDIKFPKEHGLKMMMLSLQDTYYTVAQMEWTVMKPSEGKAFVISDNPAFTINIKPEGFWGSGIGFLAPNCESTAVLTPQVAIFLSQTHNPEGVYSAQVHGNTVKAINFRTAVCSSRFLVSHSEILLKRTVKRTKLKKRGPYAKAMVG